MKFFSFFKYLLCITFSFLVLSSPVFAGANVAVKGEGDEVPSYVRANITGSVSYTHLTLPTMS